MGEHTLCLDFKLQESFSKICLWSQNPSQTKEKPIGKLESWKYFAFCHPGEQHETQKKISSKMASLMGILFSRSIIMDRVVIEMIPDCGQNLDSLFKSVKCLCHPSQAAVTKSNQ